MIQQLKDWISNPKRKFSDGVNLFNQLATTTQKNNFQVYFDKNKDENVPQFDIRFTTLINQISFIQRRIQSNPEAFAQVSTQATAKVSTNAQEVSTPTDIDQLPESFDQDKERLKEIVPIMAKLHAEMSKSDLAEDKRAGIRSQLVELDGERRAIWAKIEQYQADGLEPGVEKSELETKVEENMFAMGKDLVTRRSQLRSNITRNNSSLEKYTQAGNAAKIEEVKARLAEYETELAEINKLLADD